MSAYIAALNAAVAIEEAQRAELERAATQAVRERLTPLEERLSRILATIPSVPSQKFLVITMGS